MFWMEVGRRLVGGVDIGENFISSDGIFIEMLGLAVCLMSD